MIICERCFKDVEVQAIIRSGQKKDNCDICDSRAVHVYDTDHEFGLTNIFNELLEIYTPSDSLPPDFPVEKTAMLKDQLKENWNIFNVSSLKIHYIMKELCREKYKATPELFESPVGVMELEDEGYIEENSLLKTNEWQDFAREIKTNIRFHTNQINTSILKDFCESSKIPIKPKQEFYRGRISSQEGFKVQEMGAPPEGKASEGRANPAGISALYLANSEKTVLHEIRAALFDYVSMGTFQLEQRAEIIDFTLIDKLSPFMVERLDSKQLLINKDHIQKLIHDIAKPVRRNDSALEYLPTQYIADYIKSLGYDGIKYASTMFENGYNLAIFNEKLLKCIDVRILEIELEYTKFDEIS